MNTALVIASRELRDRSRLFLVAVILSILPFAIALLPGARSDRATTIAMAGGTFAVALGFGIAIVLGSSIVGRELAEKRMSFLFSKPVSPAAIWFGKMSAALVTSLGCFLLIIAPAYLASRQVWVTTTLHYAAAITIVFLFFVTHAVTTMVRSRSPLIGLDFVLALASAAAVYFIVRPLLLAGAASALLRVIGGIAIALLVILVIAPVVQLTLGRTDIRRNHIALSRAIWIPFAAVLAVFAAYVAWFIAVPLDEMRVFSITQSPSSDMVVVSGMAEDRGDYVATLLVNAKTGESERIATPPWWGADISRDGRMLAWTQPVLWGNDVEVYTRQLDANAKTRATGITFTGNPEIVLSDDGSRIALRRAGLLAIYDVATGKLLGSTNAFEQRAGHSMYFATSDIVRVMEYSTIRNAGKTPFAIFEFDLTQRKVTRTGELTASSGHVPASVSNDGSRMFIRRDGLIVDAHTGATLATLPAITTNDVYSSAMLRDGSVIAITDRHARIYGANGQLAHELELPRVAHAWISGETTDGKVILVGFTRTNEKGGKGRTMFVVDPQRGVIDRTVPDVKGPMPAWTPDPRLPQFRAGQKLAGVNADGKIVEW